MKVILKENIENLGRKGDIVDVSAGYGRNYLIPKKLALKVTSSNMKMIELEQAALKKRLEKARMSYQDIIDKLDTTVFTFIRKTAEKDVIFGSVSVADIKEELDKAGFEIEKKKILLSEPIKRLGNYTVPIKVFLDDRAEIKIQVVSQEEEKKGKQVAERDSEIPNKKEKEAEEGAEIVEDKDETAAEDGGKAENAVMTETVDVDTNQEEPKESPEAIENKKTE